MEAKSVEFVAASLKSGAPCDVIVLGVLASC